VAALVRRIAVALLRRNLSAFVRKWPWTRWTSMLRSWALGWLLGSRPSL